MVGYVLKYWYITLYGLCWVARLFPANVSKFWPLWTCLAILGRESTQTICENLVGEAVVRVVLCSALSDLRKRGVMLWPFWNTWHVYWPPLALCTFKWRRITPCIPTHTLTLPTHTLILPYWELGLKMNLRKAHWDHGRLLVDECNCPQQCSINLIKYGN